MSAYHQALRQIKQGEEREARKTLNAAIETDPADTAAWYLLAELAENYEEALICIKQVRRLEPENSLAIARYDFLMASQNRQGRFLARYLRPIMLAASLCTAFGVILAVFVYIEFRTSFPEPTPSIIFENSSTFTAVANTPILSATPTLQATYTAVPDTETPVSGSVPISTPKEDITSPAATQVPDTPTVAAPTATPYPVFVVDANQANIRDGPGLGFAIIDFAKTGARLEVVSENLSAEWLNVKIADDFIGWVSADLGHIE